jgi:histidyl-tRNA synthetase
VTDAAPKKEQRRKFQAIRGTRDLLPPDTALWNHVEETAHAVFATFGFDEIRPPIFEPTELFARAVGGDTDIVSKEMYTFAQSPDSAADDSAAATISLRPEATASVCRAYIEHNLQQLPQPQKLYYIGPMFRRERPQKGRYRQFYQIGAEVLGGIDAPAIDAEVIEMVMTFFDRLKLPGVQLEINSIGHAADNCRRGYVALLKSELEKVKEKLGADSQRRIETNPLRVLDSKLEHEQPIIATLPKIADHLCNDCKTHYAAVKRELELRGVFYKENWRLVRGLDYYMRTTFEITAQGLGSQNAVCGGGRYDGLVELLGGPPTKGIGFAIGEDRLILSLQEAKDASAATGKQPPFVYIAWMGANAYAAAVHAAKDLRAAGTRVELPPVEQKFGKALERASKLGAHYALILGDNEVADGTWTLKTLADGTQQKFTEPHLLDFLKKL